MKRFFITIVGITFLLLSVIQPIADERVRLSPDTPSHKIIRMHPSKVDPADLPLNSIDELHTTGVTPDIDIQNWRLSVDGKAISKPLSLKYEDLLKMKMISRKALLICPNFFADYAEWEGVPLEEILKEARVSSDYKRVNIKAVDGYRKSFSSEEIDSHLFFFALKVNGEVLPKDHGYPLRLIAVDIYGGDWVKWIDTIEVN
jgi:DMSO/TMAO reductase YedYZ molybdopterin-dependent catalytic subunit